MATFSASTTVSGTVAAAKQTFSASTTVSGTVAAATPAKQTFSATTTVSGTIDVPTVWHLLDGTVLIPMTLV